MTNHCPRCDAVVPENARFCIECGAPMREPAVGSTERLVEAESGTRCAMCGTTNPPHAAFCVNCGRALEGQAAQRPVATAVPVAPPMPAMPAPLAPVSQPKRSQHVFTHRGHTNPAMMGGVMGGVFMIGLAMLFLTGWIWPGILVLLGIMALLSTTLSGEPRSGMIGAFWMFGMAVIAQFGWWWPGMLVLVGLTAILSSVVGVTRGQR